MHKMYGDMVGAQRTTQDCNNFMCAVQRIATRFPGYCLTSDIRFSAHKLAQS